MNTSLKSPSRTRRHHQQQQDHHNHHQHHPGDVGTNQLGDGVRVMSMGELREKRKKIGLCPSCGETRTHKPGIWKSLMPETVEGLVYKGVCLKCSTLDGAKLRLGEPLTGPSVPDDMARSRGAKGLPRRSSLKDTEYRQSGSSSRSKELKKSKRANSVTQPQKSLKAFPDARSKKIKKLDRLRRNSSAPSDDPHRGPPKNFLASNRAISPEEHSRPRDKKKPKGEGGAHSMERTQQKVDRVPRSSSMPPIYTAKGGSTKSKSSRVMSAEKHTRHYVESGGKEDDRRGGMRQAMDKRSFRASMSQIDPSNGMLRNLIRTGETTSEEPRPIAVSSLHQSGEKEKAREKKTRQKSKKGHRSASMPSIGHPKDNELHADYFVSAGEMTCEERFSRPKDESSRGKDHDHRKRARRKMEKGQQLSASMPSISQNSSVNTRERGQLRASMPSISQNSSVGTRERHAEGRYRRHTIESGSVGTRERGQLRASIPSISQNSSDGNRERHAEGRYRRHTLESGSVGNRERGQLRASMPSISQNSSVNTRERHAEGRYRRHTIESEVKEQGTKLASKKFSPRSSRQSTKSWRCSKCDHMNEPVGEINASVFCSVCYELRNSNVSGKREALGDSGRSSRNRNIADRHENRYAQFEQLEHAQDMELDDLEKLGRWENSPAGAAPIRTSATYQIHMVSNGKDGVSPNPAYTRRSSTGELQREASELSWRHLGGVLSAVEADSSQKKALEGLNSTEGLRKDTNVEMDTKSNGELSWSELTGILSATKSNSLNPQRDNGIAAWQSAKPVLAHSLPTKTFNKDNDIGADLSSQINNNVGLEKGPQDYYPEVGWKAKSNRVETHDLKSAWENNASGHSTLSSGFLSGLSSGTEFDVGFSAFFKRPRGTQNEPVTSVKRKSHKDLDVSARSSISSGFDLMLQQAANVDDDVDIPINMDIPVIKTKKKFHDLDSDHSSSHTVHKKDAINGTEDEHVSAAVKMTRVDESGAEKECDEGKVKNDDDCDSGSSSYHSSDCSSRTSYWGSYTTGSYYSSDYTSFTGSSYTGSSYTGSQSDYSGKEMESVHSKATSGGGNGCNIDPSNDNSADLVGKTKEDIQLEDNQMSAGSKSSVNDIKHDHPKSKAAYLGAKMGSAGVNSMNIDEYNGNHSDSKSDHVGSEIESVSKPEGTQVSDSIETRNVEDSKSLNADSKSNHLGSTIEAGEVKPTGTHHPDQGYSYHHTNKLVAKIEALIKIEGDQMSVGAKSSHSNLFGETAGAKGIDIDGGNEECVNSICDQSEARSEAASSVEDNQVSAGAKNTNDDECSFGSMIKTNNEIENIQVAAVGNSSPDELRAKLETSGGISAKSPGHRSDHSNRISQGENRDHKTSSDARTRGITSAHFEPNMIIEASNTKENNQVSTGAKRTNISSHSDYLGAELEPIRDTTTSNDVYISDCSNSNSGQFAEMMEAANDLEDNQVSTDAKATKYDSDDSNSNFDNSVAKEETSNIHACNNSYSNSHSNHLGTEAAIETEAYNFVNTRNCSNTGPGPFEAKVEIADEFDDEQFLAGMVNVGHSDSFNEREDNLVPASAKPSNDDDYDSCYSNSNDGHPRAKHRSAISIDFSVSCQGSEFNAMLSSLEDGKPRASDAQNYGGISQEDSRLHEIVLNERKEETKNGKYCPTCGVRTHSLDLSETFMPETAEGLVYKGTCLKCNCLDTAKPKRREPIIDSSRTLQSSGSIHSRRSSQRSGSIHSRRSSQRSGSIHSHRSSQRSGSIHSRRSSLQVENNVKDEFNHGSSPRTGNCKSSIDGNESILLPPLISTEPTTEKGSDQNAFFTEKDTSSKSKHSFERGLKMINTEAKKKKKSKHLPQPGSPLTKSVRQQSKNVSTFENIDATEPQEKLFQTSSRTLSTAASTRSRDFSSKRTRTLKGPKKGSKEIGLERNAYCHIKHSGLAKAKVMVNGSRCSDSNEKWGFYSGTVDENVQPHGNGEMIYDDGHIKKGIWSNGTLVIMEKPERKRYEPNQLPGYTIGDVGRTEAMALNSREANVVAVSKLHVGDCAFIHRSNGTYTYALVKSRSDLDNIGITFQVDSSGATKSYRILQWGGVKLPAKPDILPGYKCGDPGREEDMMIDSSGSSAMSASRLRVNDACFVKRSNGSWTFAKVIERTDGEDATLKMQVDQIGSFKVARMSNCGICVRRIKYTHRSAAGLTKEDTKTFFELVDKANKIRGKH